MGSTRLLTNSTGATVGTATYDPYGRPTASTGRLSPLGFAGEYTDAETGFSYLRARYLDPATGQFLTRDPLGPGAGHPYAYVSGNPLNLTDPSGLCPFCVPLLGAAFGAITEIGFQLATSAMNGCGFSLSNINWTQVTISAAMGLMSPGQAASRIGARAGARVATNAARGLPQALTVGRNARSSVHVYYGVESGKPVYAGITNNIVRRQGQHGGRFVLEQLTPAAGVTRGQARAIEEALIVRNPGFQNLRHGISPQHAWYQDALEWGNDWLKGQGL